MPPTSHHVLKVGGPCFPSVSVAFSPFFPHSVHVWCMCSSSVLHHCVSSSQVWHRTTAKSDSQYQRSGPAKSTASNKNLMTTNRTSLGSVKAIILEISGSNLSSLEGLCSHCYLFFHVHTWHLALELVCSSIDYFITKVMRQFTPRLITI